MLVYVVIKAVIKHNVISSMFYSKQNFLKMMTHGQQTCASFLSKIYDHVLMLYCSDIACQHINIETYLKTCASFLPVCHQRNMYD